MRTIKVSIVLLWSVLLLTALGNRFFQGFAVRGQATTLAAPTNVTASDNAYSNKVCISWDAVRAATGGEYDGGG